jgi:hypothetical protein
VRALKQKGISVFGLTARGRHHWYDTPVTNAVDLTILHLAQAGIDLDAPEHFSHPSYEKGIFYAYPVEDKGELVKEIFAAFKPASVLFFDDKMSNVRSVDKALADLEIEAHCYHYRQIDQRLFVPLIAHIQFEKLFFEETILSDQEAALLKEENGDADTLFFQLVQRFLLQTSNY